MASKPITIVKSSTLTIPLKKPPFCLGTIYGDTIFLSGNIGLDPATSKLVEGDIRERVRQILRNISAQLEENGSSLQRIIKANVYLTSMKDFAAMNEAYLEFFSDYIPARTCVGVAELPLGTDVEIECTAALV